MNGYTDLRRLAAYVLLTQGGRLLLCRIANVPGAEGKWTLPGGGVEFGEHPMDTAIREVREETGLSVSLEGLAGIDSIVFEVPPPARQSIRLVFWGRILGGDLRNEEGGTTDRCAWVTPEEAAGLPLVELARIGIRLAFSRDGGSLAVAGSYGD